MNQIKKKFSPYRAVNIMLRYKKTANVLLRDVVQERLYQGALFFQNVTRFHCTVVDVISVFLPRSSRNPQMLNSSICSFLQPNFTTFGQQIRNVRTKII